MIHKIKHLQDAFTQRDVRELLIVESDGLIIHAAVIQKSPQGEALIKTYTHSSELDLPDALKEIMADIRKVHGKPPTRAILLDSHIYTTILHLPVDPAKPLPFKEMQEIIRWELEPFMSQSRMRRLGSILVGRKHLKHNDVERVIAVMEEERKTIFAALGEKKISRFGEAALRMGLISREQLEESLTLQQSFQYAEGETVCGWIPLSAKPLNGRWRWLVSGLTTSFKDYAVNSFKQAGLTLQAVYPHVGTAGASLNGRTPNTVGVFEFQGGSLGYTCLKAGQTINSRFHFSDDQNSLINSCTEFMDHQVESIWVAGRWPDLEKTVHTIESRTGRPCQKLSIDIEKSVSNGNDSSEFAGMAGAFRHFVKMAPAESTVYVPTYISSHPLTQHKYFRQGIVLVLTAAVCLFMSVTYHLKRLSLGKTVQAAGETEKARAELDSLQKEWAVLNTKKNFLKEELPQRNALIPGVLGVLQSVIPEDIMLNSFSEDGTGVFHIEGWGLSVRSIQLFKLDISEKITGLRLDSKDYMIQQRKGWLQSDGYAFQFDLIPIGDKSP